MRLNINLATKPYQDIPRILLQWGGLVLLLAVCTVVLVFKTISSRQQSRDVSAKIVTLKAEIAALDREREQALAIQRLPQNASVVETSAFLNGLIARKSFSWTRVFMQLEQIMPPRLHVVSVSPQLEPKTNVLQVHLSVAGTSREAAVELVKRLEESPSFRDARITEETEIHEKLSQDTVKFQVVAYYVPRSTPTMQSQTTETKVAETTGRAR